MKSKNLREAKKRTPPPIVVDQPDSTNSGHTLVPRADLSSDCRHARIATRAYEIYVNRGYRDDGALEDWLQAERELLNHDEPI